jgi:GNAT superfamily N-acetyltransferase
MEIIDAHWEMRNLGVKSVELSFGAGEMPPDISDLGDILSAYDYAVAKVPAGNAQIAACVQSLGFSFMECSISFKHDLDCVGNEQTQLLSARVSHSLAAGEGTDYILQRVSEGLFDSDRIYLDPYFTHAQAARRYVFWLKDEISRGAGLYDVLFDGARAGFFAYKESSPGVSYPFLIGLYPEFRGHCLGGSLIVESLLESKNQGCASSETIVSSNNIPVVKCHEAVGSRITGVNYVFVKHRDKKAADR